ncbi:hypothetical protein [Nostoc sp.]|uniref:hypothetical protein n=1 Tax=Nostoc sp. TaxID=1180 RepID=UPI002FF7587D
MSLRFQTLAQKRVSAISQLTCIRETGLNLIAYKYEAMPAVGYVYATTTLPFS